MSIAEENRLALLEPGGLICSNGSGALLQAEEDGDPSVQPDPVARSHIMPEKEEAACIMQSASFLD